MQRRPSCRFSEHIGEMAVTGKTQIMGDLGDRVTSVQEQLLRPVDTLFGDVTPRRYAEAGFERLAEMIGAETGLLRQLVEVDLLGQMRLDIIEHSLLARCPQPAAFARRDGAGRDTGVKIDQ